MNKTTDLATTLSLLAVLIAAIAVGWRLSRELPPSTEVHEAKAPPAPSHTQNLNAKAAAPSPLEHMLGGGDAGVASSKGHFGYQLDKAERTVTLAPELDQVSDIAAAEQAGTLWAVDDEGNTKVAYRFNATTGKVEQQVEFGPSGDYEGVTEVDGKLIVARNDGQLFFTDLADGGTTMVDSHLGPTCNLEGVTYQAERKRLLLSCKSELPKLSKARKSFGIYAMDLETRTMVAQPVIILARQTLDDYIGTFGAKEQKLDSSMGDEFAPKAIAIDPESGQIVLLSARGPMVVVLEPNGTLVRVDALDPVQNPQPEGLTFAADGTLYISNKSRGARAHVSAYAKEKEAVR